MHRTPKPHISDAIRQLRTWVTIACAALALCCAAQMLVYAFAAYTETRWEEVRAPRNDKPLRVVGGTPTEEPAPTPASASETRVSSENKSAGGVRTNLGGASKESAETVRAHSASDVLMKRASEFASGAGVIASLVLAILTMLGVVIAGGGSIPGVERVTTACVWSIVLGLLCLPWQRLMPTLGIPGIFAAYADMTQAIDSKAAGGASMGSFALTMQWVAAPLIAMFTALGVGLWFRAGVERGIIITSPSELDRAVEREVELIQKRGVASSAPKAVGALNHAIGGGAPEDGHRGAPAGALTAIERALEEAAAIASSAAHPDPGITRRRVQRGVADGDFKRPI